MLKIKQAFAGVGVAVLLSCSTAVHAASMPILTEGFNGTGTPAGWAIVNNSTPGGSTTWFKGNPGIFAAQAGPADSYFAANFLSAPDNGAANNISDWFITPTLTFNNGYNLSFYTRSNGALPDRMQVRFSSNGGSTNVGATPMSVGDFSTLLLDINPTLAPGGYPSAWVPYSLDLSGLSGPVSGRLAFRYFVTDNSSNGDYIGIDSVVISAIPEPETALMLALGLVMMGLGLQRKARR